MWSKLGLVYDPNTENRINGFTHSANPFPYVLNENTVRVFFNLRDSKNRSYISYFDLKFYNDNIIKEVYEGLILSPGPIGQFDDSGCSVGSIIKFENEYYLYYLGWNIPSNVPFRNSIGIAKSKDLCTFEKLFEGPILGRSIENPYSVSYPFVIKDKNKFQMWYGSHKTWSNTNGKLVHIIKSAESIDGIKWKLIRGICLENDDETQAFSRPFIIRENGKYKMWYSYRGTNYKIGYAESTDGKIWDRMDKIGGLNNSNTRKWESDMVCYPGLFKMHGNLFLLYNGNNYGETGIGLAKWIKNDKH